MHLTINNQKVKLIEIGALVLLLVALVWVIFFRG
jgi:hypothetical protein